MWTIGMEDCLRRIERFEAIVFWLENSIKRCEYTSCLIINQLNYNYKFKKICNHSIFDAILNPPQSLTLVLIFRNLDHSKVRTLFRIRWHSGCHLFSSNAAIAKWTIFKVLSLFPAMGTGKRRSQLINLKNSAAFFGVFNTTCSGNEWI